jgi:hypothetical protein
MTKLLYKNVTFEFQQNLGSRRGAEARRYGARYLGIAASVTVTDATIADVSVIEPTATGTASEAKQHQKSKANVQNGKRTYKSQTYQPTSPRT